jgi:hypothetical protein
MTWLVERGIMQSRHVVMLGPHDYLNVAYAWLLTIKLLQRSHYCLHDSVIICTTLPKLRIIT